MDFVKMHGLGNDFIIIDNYNEMIAKPGALASILCHRTMGIGADGLVLMHPSEKAVARMRIYNPDGSEAEMCGNALRCIAKYLYDRDQVKGRSSFSIETMEDIKAVQLDVSDGEVIAIEVDMGEPILNSEEIPVIGENRQVIDEQLEVDGKVLAFTAASMGNPHCVTFIDSVEKAPVKILGPLVEKHEFFPKKTNVEFIQVVDRENINMRVWERGAGETAACGTGACAAAVASSLKGVTGRKVKVHLQNGILEINWREDNRVMMKGAAEYSFKGKITGDLLNRIVKR